MNALSLVNMERKNLRRVSPDSRPLEAYSDLTPQLAPISSVCVHIPGNALNKRSYCTLRDEEMKVRTGLSGKVVMNIPIIFHQFINANEFVF